VGIVLKVTPETLIKMANDIEKQLDNIQKQFDSIDTEINRTRSYWEGDASDSHKEQYDSLKDEISQSVKRLKNHPTNLLQIANIYTETEDEVETAAQTLPEDVIV
jgi:WXG100 family type VII secretion target